jgi:hypothetical protein
MEFCSKFGYNYGFNRSDSESLSDEEDNERGLTLNIAKKRRRIRKADFNIINVRFDKLTQSNETYAGEPIKCGKCDAIMTSMQSYLKTSNDGKTKSNSKSKKKIWQCEFCSYENDVSRLLDHFEDLPDKEDVTFLLEPAPVKPTSATDQALVKEDPTKSNMLTFAIDISGSNYY